MNVDIRGMTQVTAHLKNLRIAPRKVRLLADLVRGLPLSEAVLALEFRAKRAARPLQKLLLAAAADAEHNFKLKKNDLVIKHIIVNSAVTIKRYMPRAFGRAAMIRKRGSNVTVALVSQTGAKLEKPLLVPPSELRAEHKEHKKEVSGAPESLPPAASKKDAREAMKPKTPLSLKSRLFSRKTG